MAVTNDHLTVQNKHIELSLSQRNFKYGLPYRLAI